MLGRMKLPLPIFSLIVGALLLFFGRRLFWLFVAAIGFAMGVELTHYLVQHPPPWLELVVALILGLVGAVLALLLQKIAIAVAGFLVGGHIATALVAAFVNSHAQYSGLTFVIGGIIGALLLLALFDWALIIFSSLAGAELVASNLHVPPSGTAILFLALTILGIVVQSAMFAGRRTAA
jgi:hypothetical protein